MYGISRENIISRGMLFSMNLYLVILRPFVKLMCLPLILQIPLPLLLALLLSSTESEYYAMTHMMKEGLWLRLFPKLHHLPVPHPFPLLCDNQSTLALVQSKSVSSYSKHINVRYHFIREHVSDGTFTTTWIPTEDMTADILMKPLPYPAFSKHCLSLGLVPT